MNKRTLLFLTFCAIAAVLCSSCEKKYIIDVSKSCSDCAQVKILNSNPDADASYQFYINTEKITGNALSFADLFPASVEYAAIPSGNSEVTVKLAVNDSTFESVVSGEVDLQQGKRYGIIWNGDVGKDPFVVLTNQDTPTDSGYIMAQFVNLIKTDQTVDVVSQKSGEVVFSAVPYKGVKDYVKVPVNDEYTIRETGTNIVLARDQRVGASETRNYTWYAIGKKFDTLSSSPTHIILDYYTNGYPKSE